MKADFTNIPHVNKNPTKNDLFWGTYKLLNSIYFKITILMINDPELKSMSEVFDSLQGLDSSTQRRVVDWVMAKLSSNPSTNSSTGVRRGPKPGSKRAGKKRG